jgi:hypothetical protein
MRVRLVAAPLLLTAALVAGCGSDDGGDDSSGGSASEETTTEEFCEAYAAVEETSEFDETKDAIGELSDMGLPEDAPEDAVAGFEVLANLAEEASDEKEATELGQDVDAEGQEKVNAFFTYSTETCEPASEEPSEDSSESPSDEETE